MDIHSEKILILDFGSQYTQLIARRVREAHVYCELHPFDMELAAIKEFNPGALFSPEVPSRSMIPARRPLRRPSSNLACRCSASVMACSFWPGISAAGWCRPASGNTAMPN